MGFYAKKYQSFIVREPNLNRLEIRASSWLSLKALRAAHRPQKVAFSNTEDVWIDRFINLIDF